MLHGTATMSTQTVKWPDLSASLLKPQQRMLKLGPRQLPPLIRLRHNITSLIKTSPSTAFSGTIRNRLTLRLSPRPLIDDNNLVNVSSSDASLGHNGSKIPLGSGGSDFINTIFLTKLVNSKGLNYILVRGVEKIRANVQGLISRAGSSQRGMRRGCRVHVVDFTSRYSFSISAFETTISSKVVSYVQVSCSHARSKLFCWKKTTGGLSVLVLEMLVPSSAPTAARPVPVRTSSPRSRVSCVHQVPFHVTWRIAPFMFGTW